MGGYEETRLKGKSSKSQRWSSFLILNANKKKKKAETLLGFLMT